MAPRADSTSNLVFCVLSTYHRVWVNAYKDAHFKLTVVGHGRMSVFNNRSLCGFLLYFWNVRLRVPESFMEINGVFVVVAIL